MQEWPIYFKKNIIVGNLQNSVGVVCLWTPREAFAQRIDSQLYCALGQLYSGEGINAIIRNICARPQIRTIVICGQNKTKTADALINFIENGIDEQYQIIGSEEVAIEDTITKEAIGTLRKNIKISNLEGELNPQVIQEELQKYQEESNEPWAEPELFPEREYKSTTRPTQVHGYTAEEETVAKAWLRVLYAIMAFGKEKPANHGTTQKELLDMMVIITKEDPQNIEWAPWLQFTEEHFEEYKPQIMSGEPLSGVEYTYGSRIRNAEGIDQIKTIIKKIKESYFSRQALATTWNIQKDDKSENPPCLITVQAIVQEDKLHMTVYFRSNDMYRAWPENTLAMREMQQYIANETGIKMGQLCMMANSAHIYEQNYEQAQEIIDKYYKKEIDFCRFDARGNMIISLDRETKEIVVEHQTPQGRKIQQYKGRTARDLVHQLVEEEAVSEMGHALDLGQELLKAEICLQTAREYQQDQQGTQQLLKEL